MPTTSESSSSHSTLRYSLAAGLVAVFGLLSVASAASSTDRTAEDDTWTYVDGGSFGVTPTVDDHTWCLVDAGSLGLPNPVEACS